MIAWLAVASLALTCHAADADPAGLNALFDGAKPLPVVDADPGSDSSFFEKTAPVQLQGAPGQVRAIQFNDDGSAMLTVADDGTARLWDTRTGKELKRLGLTSGERVSAAAVSADGSRLVVVSTAGPAVLDARTGAQLQSFGDDDINHVALSPDGSRALTAHWEDLALWDATNGTQVCAPKQMGGVNDLAFSPDGKRFLTTVHGLRLWDTQSCQELRHYQPVDEEVKDAAFSKDGSTILIGGTHGTLVLWDAETGAERRTFPAVGSESVLAVAFGPDGTKVAAASDDKVVRVLDVATGNVLKSFALDKPSGYWSTFTPVLSFSPDGSRLACAAFKGLTIWRIGYTKQELDEMKRELGQNVQAAPSSDNGRFQNPF